MGGVFRLLRRVLFYGLGLVALVLVAVLGVYYSGVKMPVRSDTSPLVFPNWNKTNTVEASVFYDSEVWRTDGRTHLTVNLKMPEAVERLKAFLDGGRTEVVACGPQKLLVHSLIDGVVGIDGDLIRIDGMMDMELAGVINARDDMALRTAIRIGHDRTTISAQVEELTLGQVPQQMIQTVLDQKSRFTLTREQIFDMIAKDLSPDDAALFATHREALDQAIESVQPVSVADAFHLDAVISVNEDALIDAAIDKFVEASGKSGSALAGLLGPSKAHAGFLKNLTKELEKAGGKLKDELESNSDLRNLLSDPNANVGSLVAAFSDCKVTF